MIGKVSAGVSGVEVCCGGAGVNCGVALA